MGKDLEKEPEKEPQKEVAKEEVILLDISMFILNILSSERIYENYYSDNIVLEVPSALVNMIWTARANDERGVSTSKNILFELIYAHLIGFQKNPIHKKSKDLKVIHLLETIDDNLQGLAQKAYNRILYEFAPIIDGTVKQPLINNPMNGEKKKTPPIRRYEAELSIENYELYSLQSAYKKELGLDAHPLYDLYFLQVHHAQSIGLAASPIKKRKILALGRQTYTTIKEWKSGIDEKWPEKKYEGNDEKQIKDIFKNYATREWDSILLGLILDVTLSYFIPGGGIALAVVTNVIIPTAIDISEEKTDIPITKILLAVIGVFFLISLGFIGGVQIKNYGSFFPKRPTDTPSAPPVQGNFLATSVGSISLQEFITLTPIYTAIIPQPSYVETPSISTSQLNYCLYVIQPSDTLQSVASWFSVSENEIRASDERVNRGTFVLHQMVRIDAPCCTHIGVNNGFSYSVQPKDNVLSLATSFSIPVEKITSSNNLADSRYIQTGQMLCIPYP